MATGETQGNASASAGAEVAGANFDLPAIAAPETQDAARLIVGPPLPEFLARGLAIIQYSAENLRILPVFGPAALGLKPQVGHIHVTVDDAAGHWADANGEQIILQGLSPGLHRIRIDLSDPTHYIVDSRTVQFEIPHPVGTP